VNEVRFLIIGAGPTGLGAAHRLQEFGVRDWLLIDRATEAGGLAGSLTDAHGFTWDLGGHVQFSHYESFDRYMDRALGPDGWLHHQRESWIRIADRFVPYPFQNNLHRLPPKLRWKCVKGLLDVAAAPRAATPPAHFQEWIDRTFGTGIAALFLNPYNFKVWAHPLDMMAADWVGERVAVPPLERVLKAICLEQDDVSWGPNNTFRFPRQGGTGAVWRSLCRQLPPSNVALGAGLMHLDPNRCLARLTDGRAIAYQYLISTMPLDQLARLIGRADLIDACQLLPHSSTHIIGIGLRGHTPDQLRTKCWMYFPESNCPFYRVTVFSNYSPFNVPDPENQWSLMAEIAESRFKPVDLNGILKAAVRGLLNTKLLKSTEDILCSWHRRLEYGYPVPGVQRDEALAVLLPALEQYGIYSRGRFGAWKYEVSNQDHSFAQGREVVERLLGRVNADNGPEPTLTRPNWVNRRRNP
jgi:protoporphyrinogen oxidase